ncbi:hypothetical protein [Fusobacterium polymorphum]|uniref:hypothetical protein n=1 Tax=Fusobacterium nucleatum subsp. polymorphum TaxID=76857 RepID=UPI00300AEBFD
MLNVNRNRNNNRKEKLLKMKRKIKIFSRKKKKYIPKIIIEEIKEKIKKNSEMLNFLLEKNFYSNDNIKNEIITIEIPEIFSLIKKPDKVFEILQKIINAFKKGVKEIEFDYSKNIELEIGAVSLKNVICLDILRQGVTIGGNFPGYNDLDDDGAIKEKYNQSFELLVFSGLFKKLRMNEKDFIKSQNYYKPLTLPLIGGGKTPIMISCKTFPLGKIEHEITKYFNKALQNINKELNENGERLFDKIIGEVIANCQEHSGEFNQYFCSGHYSKINANIGNYQLTIFNFGQSIAEGFKNSIIPPKVKERMDELLNKHISYFKIFSNWDENALLTLFSLQDRVSRLYDDRKTRGTGTVRFLEAFQNVGGCSCEYCSTMTIISGNSQIIINNDDEICKIENKQISFNKEKSLDYKPDERYVKKLERYFPGTIISLNIFLDRNWLEDKN